MVRPLVLSVCAAALLAAGCAVSEQAEKVECRNNLKQLQLAEENFRNTFRQPCWKTPTVGKAGLSWRVELLPFLEQVNVYKTLMGQTNNFTTPVYDAGGSATSGGAAARDTLETRIGVLTLRKHKYPAGTTVFRRVVKADRPDAFVVVETTDVVPWGKGGDDLVVEAGAALPKMGGHFSGGFLALCADGQIRWVPESLSDQEKIAALFDGKGGEVQ
jgi:hypothetical protein